MGFWGFHYMPQFGDVSPLPSTSEYKGSLSAREKIPDGEHATPLRKATFIYLFQLTDPIFPLLQASFPSPQSLLILSTYCQESTIS